MAGTPSNKSGIIRRDNLRVVSQPAMLDCGGVTEAGSKSALAIVPLMEGDVVAGFEVRCGCGASAIVECIYGDASTREGQS